MASFSAYTRYDNRKQFQYNKRNNDVVNNTNQRSRNNISNRNTINNDHVNRLYNWQQRNEQKKNSLKKKIAKAETPSFTPTKYAKARNFRPVHKPTESDALQKHRERLNRAREKEKESADGFGRLGCDEKRRGRPKIDVRSAFGFDNHASEEEKTTRTNCFGSFCNNCPIQQRHVYFQNVQMLEAFTSP